MLVYLPKTNTQHQVHIVSQIFRNQSDLLVFSHLSWRDASVSIQHFRKLAREEQSSCQLEVSWDWCSTHSLSRPYSYVSCFVIWSLSTSDPSLNENTITFLILQSVGLRCNFARTGSHSNNIVGSTIILLPCTNRSVYAYVSPTFKQACS